MRYYIIAGEASGDLHGSNLMRGLYANDRDADCRFWGGEKMDSVYRENQDGTGLVHNYKDDAIMGFFNVVTKLHKIASRIKQCQGDIMAWKPDVVILIDYPGFNFKIAEFAHSKGFKVFYYIAPKVWASRESRIKKLKKHVDKLFIIFPFEKEYFDKKGIDYVYKGNPLIDAVDADASESRDDFLGRLGMQDRKYIAILAGSRKVEIDAMMPVCMDFVKKFTKKEEYSDYGFIVAGAPSRQEEDYSKYIDNQRVRIIFGETHNILRHAEAAIVNSGTASLETCLIGTPQVAAFACSDFNFALGRQIIKVDYISLGNLILGRKAFKELIQYYFNSDNLVSEVSRLIEDKEYRENMKNDYMQIREALGGSGASNAVAKAMIENLTD